MFLETIEKDTIDNRKRFSAGAETAHQGQRK